MILSLLRQTFVQNAFVAGILIAVVAGIAGYFVVLRSEAFAAHALSHVGFAGATLAALLGANTILGASGFTVLAALGIGALGERIRGRNVEIGITLAFALGLGVLFLHLYTNSASEMVGVLFGSILSVTRADIVWTAALGGAVLVLLALIFRPLLFVSVDPDVAETRGVPVKLLSMLFMFLLAITVAEAIRVVGVLLIFSLIVAPAAIAQHITHRPLSAIILSVVFGVAFVCCGMFLALATRFPVSFYISVLAALCYFLVVGASHVIMRPHAAAMSARKCDTGRF